MLQCQIEWVVIGDAAIDIYRCPGLALFVGPAGRISPDVRIDWLPKRPVVVAVSRVIVRGANMIGTAPVAIAACCNKGHAPSPGRPAGNGLAFVPTGDCPG